MSINLFVGEVNTQTNSIKSYCNSVISGMTHVQTALSKIILEPSLKGNTYDSAKAYFQTAYLPATRGFILVCETAIRANQQFISDYKSNVDANSLQEDVLISQISRLDSMSSALDSIAIPKVFTQNIVDNLQNAKEKTAKKLDKLREFNHTSVSIFDDLEQQLQNLETGVTMIAEGKAWNGTTGTFSTTGLNMDWAQTIDQAWEERLKEQAKKDKPKKKKAKIPWWKKTMTGALDFLQGAGIAVVENNTGEKAKKVNQKFQNNQNYHYGKLFGTGLTGIQSLTEMYQGANMAIKGLQGIAGATVMSGGALAPGAGAIAGVGATVGAGALAHGGLVFSNTIQNSMDNIQQMQVSDDINNAIKDGVPAKKHKVISDQKKLEGTGEPNSSSDLLNEDGSVKQRRWYGKDGKALEDIDYNHTDDGTHTFPHRHKWDWSKIPPRLKD
ncbi:T7SS effector LXG polymorphic toxin [Carnobacterium divergens]|uniref:T7SS effector LXG polymorphic toxin n=1 Tax=Carnobacterium divergens TaxID=2748 RepID=UPI0007F559CE|nr:T7SS effector LXG polymorphic toxin [Carnobacterium divergens]SBO17938.1 putative transposase [Carnobacterium divergens]